MQSSVTSKNELKKMWSGFVWVPDPEYALAFRTTVGKYNVRIVSWNCEWYYQFWDERNMHYGSPPFTTLEACMNTLIEDI